MATINLWMTSNGFRLLLIGEKCTASIKPSTQASISITVPISAIEVDSLSISGVLKIMEKENW